jgi:hypothetical protein
MSCSQCVQRVPDCQQRKRNAAGKLSFARGVTMSQIAIAVAAISAFTKKLPFWVVSLVFGVGGWAFFVLAAMIR